LPLGEERRAAAWNQHIARFLDAERNEIILLSEDEGIAPDIDRDIGSLPPGAIASHEEVLVLAKSQDRNRPACLAGGERDGIPLSRQRHFRQGQRDRICGLGEAEIEGRTKLQRPMALQADHDRIVVEQRLHGWWLPPPRKRY
tara:strand:+ start:65482 stop:65910 length:429 start_codon:yes stop_codon:yes gene_type:complete